MSDTFSIGIIIKLLSIQQNNKLSFYTQNRIGGAMVVVLASSEVDGGFCSSTDRSIKKKDQRLVGSESG
jgi:hypothetical protein